MNLTILSADAACCTLLAALHGRCFPEAWSENAFADLMAMPGAFALLISLEGADFSPPIGFVLARIGGGECEIISLGVLPEHRGAGVGRKILRAAVLRARKLGAEEILLEVAANNVAAIALYQAAAFERVGRRKNYYRDANDVTADAFVMRCSLMS